MKKGSLWFAWILVGILGFGAAMMTSPEPEASTKPNSNSTAPSGTFAFKELLKKKGYEVRSSRDTLRPLKPNEVGIAIYSGQFAPFNEFEPNNDPLRGALLRHFEAGGKALIISLPGEQLYVLESKTEITVRPAMNPEGRSLTITESSTPGMPLSFVESDIVQVAPAYEDDTKRTVSWLTRPKKGRAIYAADGVGLTNQFVDQADNAEYFLHLVDALAPKGGKLVFLEAAYGNASTPSLVQALGPAFEGGWAQIIIAFLVLVLALGVRFGLPKDSRFRQRGAKEFADAISDTMGRSAAYQMAGASIVSDAKVKIRKRLKMSSDEEITRESSGLPEELFDALMLAEATTKNRGSERGTINIFRQLDSELNSFLGSELRQRARKKKF